MPVIRTIDQADSADSSEPILQECRKTLRVPLLSQVFEVYCAYPTFLKSVWSQISPNLGTRAFETLAGKLRKEAEMASPAFCTIDSVTLSQLTREEKRSLAYNCEAFHHTGPKLLLMTAAIESGLRQSQPSDRYADTTEEINVPEIPRGIDLSAKYASPDDRVSLSRVLELLDLPVLTAELRVLQKWPGIMTAIYNGLTVACEHQDQKSAVSSLAHTAIGLAAELPHRVFLCSTGTSRLSLPLQEEHEIRSLTGIILNAYSASVLLVAAARAAVLALETAERRRRTAPES